MGQCVGGVLLIVTESEFHLIYFDTSSKIQPALVTQGDAPVTVRQEKIHGALEKAGADPDFVRFMISRDDFEMRSSKAVPNLLMLEKLHTND